MLLRLPANRPNGFTGVAETAGKPPKPVGTTRFTRCPVKRSIACIDDSSIGATIVIALP